jgi:hypothetical protein
MMTFKQYQKEWNRQYHEKLKECQIIIHKTHGGQVLKTSIFGENQTESNWIEVTDFELFDFENFIYKIAEI